MSYRYMLDANICIYLPNIIHMKSVLGLRNVMRVRLPFLRLHLPICRLGWHAPVTVLTATSRH